MHVLYLFDMPESDALTEPLRDKAFLALEDAVQEWRYRRPHASFAIRFALAYLWAYGGCRDRRPYDQFWREFRAEFMAWRFNTVSACLDAIYKAHGIEREESVSRRMWKHRQATEALTRRI